ncbi:MAG: hypothetical protein ACFB4I_02295 [Cyanophyceae cyanobacterium]
MSDKTLTRVLTSVFFILGLIGVLRHEMWFDELQAWLIARDSQSIADLFRNLKYEGQPGLWHLFLHLISRLTHNPISMQLFHLGIATLTIYIFVGFSPFSKAQKFLFTFSYFPFYEYAVISRNYGLGVLFIFIFCALFPKRNYLVLFLMIAVLANTNIIALLVAISLAATLLFEHIFYPQKPWCTKTNWQFATGLYLAILGMASAVYQIMPPADRPYGKIGGELQNLTANTRLGDTLVDLVLANIVKLAKTLFLIWKSFIPIPYFLEYEFWNRNIASAFPLAGKVGVVLVSLGIIAFLAVFFRKHPTVFFLYSFGTGLMLLFMHTISAATRVRHVGYLFVLSLACYWLLNSCLRNRSRLRKTEVRGIEKYQSFFLSSILCLQLFSGIFAYAKDLVQPFSVNQKVADYIKDNDLENAVVVGIRDFPFASLSAYLNKEIYFYNIERYGTYLIWNKARKQKQKNRTLEHFIGKMKEIQVQENKEVLILLQKDIDFSDFDLKITKLKDFKTSISFYEGDYYLYLLKP